MADESHTAHHDDHEHGVGHIVPYRILVATGLALLFLTWVTVVSYNNDVLRLPLVSASWIWWTTLLFAIVFALLAHGVVQWNVNRMNCLEALKVSE